MSKEYTNRFKVDFGADGKSLLPVVTQESESKDVLILAFVNEEAFEETLRSGYATFWSRSRKQLWKKGETSGDLLRVNEIRVNCEQNSFLFLVTPEGKGACHAKRENGDPHTSCYYRKIDEDGWLKLIEK
ncbi:MAG TPA: phosphoribosyl-AMP cyclohydrolase [Prolixibacteraceae bacterium]|nr:phosphoribosyl-AMP cyclohydrolase [Prolixibacteraceae bacterium]